MFAVQNPPELAIKMSSVTRNPAWPRAGTAMMNVRGSRLQGAGPTAVVSVLGVLGLREGGHLGHRSQGQGSEGLSQGESPSVTSLPARRLKGVQGLLSKSISMGPGGTLTRSLCSHVVT